MQKVTRVPVATWKVHAVRGSFGLGGRAAALSLALLIACSGGQVKRVPPQGEGGEAGAAGEADPSASNAGTSSDVEIGGAGGSFDPGQGSAGDGTSAGTSATGGDSGKLDGLGGADGDGGPVAEAGAGSGGAAGAESGPPVPVSACGAGKWFAGEGLCGECPPAQQVIELDCADYASAQILTTTNGQLQFAFASLPAGVQAHEASPVELSVTYVTPSESHLRLLRFNTGGWSIDLKQSPDPPETLIVPPFITADVCGDVFHSKDPVRFDRVVGPAITNYVKVCP